MQVALLVKKYSLTSPRVLAYVKSTNTDSAVLQFSISTLKPGTYSLQHSRVSICTLRTAESVLLYAQQSQRAYLIGALKPCTYQSCPLSLTLSIPVTNI